MTSLKIAVIGSGVAGLTVTHMLQREHHVTLFEKNDRLGGHTHTVTIPDGPDAGTPIDTGFIVMNHRNYPLLTTLFKQLGVVLRDSDMSFGYHDVPSGLQYSGTGINGLFAQRRNLLRPAFLCMVRDVLRFFRMAEADLAAGRNLQDRTLGEYLAVNGFGQAFVEHHLVPMGAAIWSTPCDEMLAFPAQSFVQFLHNHGLLTVNDRPQWRTVVGGSCDYIRRMQQQWGQVDVRLGARIAGVARTQAKVRIALAGGASELYDHVVIATHADQVLPLLSDPDARERESLGHWQYAASRTVLHTDERVMPTLRRVWSSWNFRRIEGNRTCLTYHMNRLQGLQTERQYFVSLNPPDDIEDVLYQFSYMHPLYTRQALVSRPRLQALSGRRNTWFAGSYFGDGFHEDAVRSAIAVARGFGLEL